MVHVVLTGFMGTGKTEVGRRLAELLQGRAAGVGGADVVVVFEKGGEARDDRCVVVDDQQTLPDVSHVQKSYSRIVPKQPQKRQTHLSC